MPHLGPVNQDLAAQQGAPRHRDDNAFRYEKRLVAGLEAFDYEVFDEEAAGHQVGPEAPDPHLPLDLRRRRPLGLIAHRRPKIDRHD